MIDLPAPQISVTQHLGILQGTVARMLIACAMGAAIGWERERRHKASGLRTNMLICMGAALFTTLSAMLAGDLSPNKGQVASNIVQGIGFLGAGLILHSRSRVLGLTSAATVWVVAAIGMACGTGLYIEAIFATAIVYTALRFVGLMESQASWKRFPMIYEVRGTEENAMFAEILSVLDREHLRLQIVDRDKLGAQERVSFTISLSSVRHKEILAKLNASDATDKVVAYHDDEED